MPNITSITLADAQSTPVDHTFDPSGNDRNGLFWLVDRSQSNALGFWQISIDFRVPTSPTSGTSANGRVYKVKIGLHEPVLANVTNSTVTGVEPSPEVAYIPRAFLEFNLPERASLLNRKDLRKMAANLLDNSQIIDTIENLSRPY